MQKCNVFAVICFANGRCNDGTFGRFGTTTFEDVPIGSEQAQPAQPAPRTGAGLNRLAAAVGNSLTAATIEALFKQCFQERCGVTTSTTPTVTFASALPCGAEFPYKCPGESGCANKCDGKKECFDGSDENEEVHGTLCHNATRNGTGGVTANTASVAGKTTMGLRTALIVLLVFVMIFCPLIYFVKRQRFSSGFSRHSNNYFLDGQSANSIENVYVERTAAVRAESVAAHYGIRIDSAHSHLDMSPSVDLGTDHRRGSNRGRGRRQWQAPPVSRSARWHADRLSYTESSVPGSGHSQAAHAPNQGVSVLVPSANTAHTVLPDLPASHVHLKRSVSGSTLNTNMGDTASDMDTSAFEGSLVGSQKQHTVLDGRAKDTTLGIAPSTLLQHPQEESEDSDHMVQHERSSGDGGTHKNRRSGDRNRNRARRPRDRDRHRDRARETQNRDGDQDRDRDGTRDRARNANRDRDTKTESGKTRGKGRDRGYTKSVPRKSKVRVSGVGQANDFNIAVNLGQPAQEGGRFSFESRDTQDWRKPMWRPQPSESSQGDTDRVVNMSDRAALVASAGTSNGARPLGDHAQPHPHRPPHRHPHPLSQQHPYHPTTPFESEV